MMHNPCKVKDLYIYQGDTHLFSFSVMRQGQPLNLKDGEIRMIAKQGQFTLEPVIKLSDEGENIVDVLFPAELTQHTKIRHGHYDLRFIYGDMVVTLCRGSVFVTPSITKICDYNMPIDKSVIKHKNVTVSANPAWIFAGDIPVINNETKCDCNTPPEFPVWIGEVLRFGNSENLNNYLNTPKGN